jgi:hypothetical protein
MEEKAVPTRSTNLPRNSRGSSVWLFLIFAVFGIMLLKKEGCSNQINHFSGV